jgi:hypothetical protein
MLLQLYYSESWVRKGAAKGDWTDPFDAGTWFGKGPAPPNKPKSEGRSGCSKTSNSRRRPQFSENPGLNQARALQAQGLLLSCRSHSNDCRGSCIAGQIRRSGADLIGSAGFLRNHPGAVVWNSGIRALEISVHEKLNLADAGAVLGAGRNGHG